MKSSKKSTSKAAPKAKPAAKKKAAPEKPAKNKTAPSKKEKEEKAVKKAIKPEAKKNGKPEKAAKATTKAKKPEKAVKPEKAAEKNQEKPKAPAKTGGGRPGRKPKKTDEEEEGFVLEAPPEPHPVSKKKQKSAKDLAKERILVKLKEKQIQEQTQRQYLPSKKKKYTLEYIIKTSAVILFDFVSTSAGLEQWFADKVDDHLDIFTFYWEGNAQKAEMVDMEDLEFVKFRWVDNPYDEFFEFRITSTEITGDTVLLITDFADQNELRDVEFLWDNQVKTLMKRMGLGA